MLEGLINRHATMMAYNDTLTLIAFLTLPGIALAMLLPRRAIPDVEPEMEA